MADNFDPYRIWLGIPRSEQPPHHYRLLGIGLFETDLDVIEGAADRQMSHVQKHKIGAHSAESQRLLNELASAKLTLLNAGKKAAYDRTLRARLESQAATQTASSTSVQPATVRSIPTGTPVAQPTPIAEVSNVVHQDYTGAGDRPVSRKNRKAANKSKTQFAAYIVPIVLLLAGVGGWLALRNNALHPAPPRPKAIAKSSAKNNKPVNARDTAAPSIVAPDTATPDIATPHTATPDTAVADTATPQTTATVQVPPPKEQPAPLARPGTSKPEIPPNDEFSVGDTGRSSRWVELLPLVRIEDAVAGTWVLENGSLRCVPKGQECCRLMLPNEPPKEYVLEATVARQEKAEVGFGLISGSHRFVLVLGDSRSAAFDLVDGKPGADNAAGFDPSLVFAPKRQVQLTIVVRQSGVALDCDHRRIFTWRDGLERLGAGEAFNTPDPHRLFLAGSNAPLRFYRLRLRALSGDSPARFDAAGAVAAAKIDAAKTPASSPDELPADPPRPAPVQMKLLVANSKPGADSLTGNPAAGKQPAVLLKVLQEKGDAPRCVTISDDGRLVMWTCPSGVNVLWDVRKGVQIGNINPRMYEVAFTQDNRRLITLDLRTTYVWDVANGQLAGSFTLPTTNGVVIPAVAPDGGTVAFHDTENHALNVFDSLNGQLLYRPDDVPGIASVVCLSPGGKYALVTGHFPQGQIVNGRTSYLKVFDLKAKRQITYSGELKFNPLCAAFSGDGMLATHESSSKDHVLQVWNLAKDELHRSIKLPNIEPVRHMPFTRDGRRLLSQSGSSLRLWDVDTGEQVVEFGHENGLVDADITGDGRMAVSADGAGTVRLWRLGESSIAASPTADTARPPDLADQQAAAALIKDVFADDFAKAKKPPDKLALAEKLLSQSRDSKDLTEKYVLIGKARDLAREAGEPLLFLQAIQELGATFTVDMYEMALSGLDALARENLAPKTRLELAEALLPLADRALADSKYEEARKLLNAAQNAARKTNDTTLAKTIAVRLAEIADVKKQAEGVKAAEDALARDPDDPAANLTLGKIYCLTKEDWARGLPLLAKSDDDAFKGLAVQEIADPKEPAEQVALADGWYALGDAAGGKEKTRLLLHAESWYRAALPALSGLTQVKVAKRLEEIAALHAGDSGEQVASGDKPAASTVAASAKPLSLRIKSAIKKENYTSTRLLGSSTSGSKFAEVPPAGGLLIGFNYTADENSSGRVSSIQGIYQIGKNAVEGAVWGQPRGAGGTITAKKGYAVAGLTVRGSPSLSGFEVMFMKIGGGTLDPKDKYTSPWIGSTINYASSSAGGDGQPVIGIFGTSDYRVFGLGLVQLPAQ